MRTPGHDFELATGYLLHEGVLRPGDLKTVAYCTDADLDPAEEFNVVTVSLNAAPPVVPAERHVGSSLGSAACGVCGKESIADALGGVRAAAWSGGSPDPEVLRALPESLRGCSMPTSRDVGRGLSAAKSALGPRSAGSR